MIDIINGILNDLGIIGSDTLTVNHLMFVWVFTFVLTFIADVIKGIIGSLRKQL